MCLWTLRCPFPPLNSRQLFAKVIVTWFIRPMSCVLEATAGRLLTAPGFHSKEQSESQKYTKNASISELSLLNYQHGICKGIFTGSAHGVNTLTNNVVLVNPRLMCFLFASPNCHLPLTILSSSCSKCVLSKYFWLRRRCLCMSSNSEIQMSAREPDLISHFDNNQSLSNYKYRYCQ